MDLDPEEKIDESEIDALGIKKKDDADIDVDVVDAIGDEPIDPLLDEKEEESDGGIFGDDKELEDYMLSGYEENY